MTTPMIAVIVPVYNVYAYLEQCISSILAQTFQDFTLYLVDDGSTDGSGTLCDRASRADSRITVLHKENGGLQSAWKCGVDRSREPWLFFVDGDDWVDPDALEKLAVPILQQEGGGTIVCGSYFIERTGKGTRERVDNALQPGDYTGNDLQEKIRERIVGNENRTLILSRCMKLISRELITDNLHWCDPRIRMGEDVNIMVPAILDAQRIVVLRDAAVYRYRFVGSSMVHRYDEGLYENIVRLREILKKILADKGIPDAEGMAEREFLFLLFIEMKNEIRRKDVPGPEVCARIRSLCEMEHTDERLAGVCVRDPANRLLAFFMRRPLLWRTRLVRLVFTHRGS